MKPTLKSATEEALHTVSAVTSKVHKAGSAFRSLLLPASGSRPVSRTPAAAPGSSPGIESLAGLSAAPEAGTVSCSLLDYGPEGCSTRAGADIVTLLAEPRPPHSRVRWINVNGLHAWVVNHLRQAFQFHTLAAEDVLRTAQRPKLEAYDNCLFLIVRMMMLKDGRLISEQVSLFLFDDLVLTFQEQAGDVWDPIRQRIEKTGVRIRSQGAAYLLYALLDAVVDHCFPILEQFGEQLEGLEKEVMDNATPATQQRILAAKRDLSMLRRVLWPLRDIANELHSEKNEDIPAEVKAFMRDVYDHTIQVMDILETCREMAAGLNDLYMSVVSNRMNEIMKVLTIMASFFIPITFVAGVYGMNFEFIPELHWKYSYLVFWGICLAIVTGLLAYFWRRGWIGRR
jgi:magnesium transporter